MTTMRKDPIWVKCPACGWEQKTFSRKYVKCFRCGHRYKIFPRRKPPRITYEKRMKRFMGYKLGWDYVMHGKMPGESQV